MSVYKKYKTKEGFTLIETFVAITILMIAILGPMSMIAKFYADSTFAKNQIAASFLAQDGIETIQNIISHNSGARVNELIYDEIECDSLTTDWLRGLADCKNGGCNVSSIQGKVDSCSNAKGCKLKKENGFYVHTETTAGASIFTRKIVIVPGNEEINGDPYRKRSAQVTSYVWWSQKGDTKGPVVVSGMVFQNQCPGM